MDIIIVLLLTNETGEFIEEGTALRILLSSRYCLKQTCPNRELC
jgi:hypothetical protein